MYHPPAIGGDLRCRESIFYRQKRMDGGYRTGLEVDGETVVRVVYRRRADRCLIRASAGIVDLRCAGRSSRDGPRCAQHLATQEQPRRYVRRFRTLLPSSPGGNRPRPLLDLIWDRVQGRARGRQDVDCLLRRHVGSMQSRDGRRCWPRWLDNWAAIMQHARHPHRRPKRFRKTCHNDCSIRPLLITHLKRISPLAEKRPEDAERLAKQLIENKGTNAIVSPRSSHRDARRE